MKKNERTKSSLNRRRSKPAGGIARFYFPTLLEAHRNAGALRIIIAYVFAIFALLSLWFTVELPITSDFLPPTEGAKAESRAITIGMAIANILTYSVVLNWRKNSRTPMFIRVIFVCMIFYFDVFLIGRVVYELIRAGAFP